MKILFISDDFPPYNQGGSCISTSLNVKYLAKKERCFVLTQRFQKKSWKFEGINVYPYLHNYSPDFTSSKKMLLNQITDLFQHKNKNIVSNFVADKKIELIQIESNSLSLIRQVLNLNLPIIIDVRDTGFVCPIMFRNFPCDLYCNSCLNRYFSKKYGSNNLLFRFFLPFFVRLINFKFRLQSALLRVKISKKKSLVIIPLSKFIEKELKKKGFRSKFNVIYNISDLENLTTPKRKNKLVFAGIIETPKGIWDAIHAYEILNDKNLIFEILGNGPEYSNVKEYIKNKKLKNIRLIGKVPNKKVLNLYSESKIIIAPSIWPEPFGRFIQEGISTKTPVIATNVGGIPEGIEHRKTGILVEPNNPVQLAEAIKELLINKKLYNSISKNLEKEQKKYSPGTIIKKRLAVYKELLKNENKQK